MGQGPGYPGGSRPRLGRRLAGRLCADHYRSRSDSIRPAVRALPQSRARLDAGLRHRLLAEANWRESTRIFKRTIPFPCVLGRVCPAPCEEHCRRDEVDEAIAIRDSHRYAGDQVLKAMLDEGVDPPLPFERQAPIRPAGRGHRLRPGRHGRRVLPAPGRPRRDRLRARPGARRDAPLRHPAVPPAQGRGPRGRVRVGHPARRQDRLQRRARRATSRSTT